MAMPGVWIDWSTSFVFHRQVHLIGPLGRDDVTGIERAIIRNHDTLSVAIFNVYLNAIKMISVLPEHKPFRTFLDHCIDRKH